MTCSFEKSKCSLARADWFGAAEQVKLGQKELRFLFDFVSDKPQVDQDLQDGMRAGVSGTPTFSLMEFS